MNKLQKFKAVTGSIIAAILGLLPAFFKKKLFVLWYKGPDHQPYLLCDFAIFRDGTNPGKPWFKKSGPMSFRQCKKTMQDLWALGPGVTP